MKSIALILLFAATAAQAGCPTDLTNAVDTMRPLAIAAAPAKLHASLQDMRVFVRPLRNDNLGEANTLMRHLTMTLDPRNCEVDPLLRDAIIAHEFGHHIAGNFEDDADRVAARIFPADRLPQLVALLEKGCVRGDQWYCRKAKNFGEAL